MDRLGQDISFGASGGARGFELTYGGRLARAKSVRLAGYCERVEFSDAAVQLGCHSAVTDCYEDP